MSATLDATGSLYELDLPLLEALQPDIILTPRLPVGMTGRILADFQETQRREMIVSLVVLGESPQSPTRMTERRASRVESFFFTAYRPASIVGGMLTSTSTERPKEALACVAGRVAKNRRCRGFCRYAKGKFLLSLNDCALAKDNPHHSRARVARAWIDYIVGTKMARGTRWLLGGGSRKRAFIGAREAASAESEFFVRVEAEFALWEMLVRERNVTEATTIARKLARDFLENRKLVKLLETTGSTLHP